MASSDTKDLIARCQRGDAGAFHELFVRYRQDVTRIILHHFSNASEADLEDLVQDVFVQVHRSIGRFNGRSKFSTWLYRVTVNVVLMNLRAQKSRPKATEELPNDLTVEPNSLPEQQAMKNQRVAAFHRLIEQVPEKKRTVFVLHELQGMSLGDIAELTNTPVLTVRTRLFYARKQILSLLNEDPTLAPYAHLAERKQTSKSSKGSPGRKTS